MLSAHCYTQNFPPVNSINVHSLTSSTINILSPYNRKTLFYKCNEIYKSHNKNYFPNTLFPFGSL